MDKTFLKDVIALNLVVVTLDEIRRIPKSRRGFFWRGMVDDVKGFCETCGRANRYIYVLMLFYA